MNRLKIERIGGVGGFGGPHLKSRGEMMVAELSAADQASVEQLFASQGKASKRGGKEKLRDGFSYRISRLGETIEVPEPLVPAALLSRLKDTIE